MVGRTSHPEYQLDQFEGIPDFPLGSGSFLTRLCARFAKCPLNVFEIVNSFSILTHMFVVGALKPASYPLSRGIKRDLNPIFVHIAYKIQHFG